MVAGAAGERSVPGCSAPAGPCRAELRDEGELLLQVLDGLCWAGTRLLDPCSAGWTGQAACAAAQHDLPKETPGLCLG